MVNRSTVIVITDDTDRGIEWIKDMDAIFRDKESVSEIMDYRIITPIQWCDDEQLDKLGIIAPISIIYIDRFSDFSNYMTVDTCLSDMRAELMSISVSIELVSLAKSSDDESSCVYDDSASQVIGFLNFLHDNLRTYRNPVIKMVFRNPYGVKDTEVRICKNKIFIDGNKIIINV